MCYGGKVLYGSDRASKVLFKKIPLGLPMTRLAWNPVWNSEIWKFFVKVCGQTDQPIFTKPRIWVPLLKLFETENRFFYRSTHSKIMVIFPKLPKVFGFWRQKLIQILRAKFKIFGPKKWKIWEKVFGFQPGLQAKPVIGRPKNIFIFLWTALSKLYQTQTTLFSIAHFFLADRFP